MESIGFIFGLFGFMLGALAFFRMNPWRLQQFSFPWLIPVWPVSFPERCIRAKWRRFPQRCGQNSKPKDSFDRMLQPLPVLNPVTWSVYNHTQQDLEVFVMAVCMQRGEFDSEDLGDDLTSR